jgi:hypothetical protein
MRIYYFILIINICLSKFAFTQEDDFFAPKKKKDSLQLDYSIITEFGIGIPVFKWASAIDDNSSILSPVLGEEGLGYKPNLFFKAGIESRIHFSHLENRNLAALWQVLASANFLNRMEWENEFSNDAKIRNEVWDAGIYLGFGIDYTIESFSLSMIPAITIPVYMVLPNYVLNDSFSAENASEEWIEGQKYTVYSNENFVINNVLNRFTFAFGGEVRLTIMERAYAKFEYFQMHVGRRYILETETFLFNENSNSFNSNTSNQHFISNYNITNLKVGIGIKL